MAVKSTSLIDPSITFFKVVAFFKLSCASFVKIFVGFSYDLFTVIPFSFFLTKVATT